MNAWKTLQPDAWMIPGQVNFSFLQLEKKIPKDLGKRLRDCQAECERIEALAVEISPMTVRKALQESREKLLAVGRVSKEEIDAWSKSSKERQAVSHEQHKIAMDHLAKAREEGAKLCAEAITLVLPSIEKAVANHNAREIELHTEVGLSKEILPVTKAIRSALETIKARAAATGNAGCHPHEHLAGIIDLKKL